MPCLCGRSSSFNYRPLNSRSWQAKQICSWRRHEEPMKQGETASRHEGLYSDGGSELGINEGSNVECNYALREVG